MVKEIESWRDDNRSTAVKADIDEKLHSLESLYKSIGAKAGAGAGGAGDDDDEDSDDDDETDHDEVLSFLLLDNNIDY